MFLQKRKLFTLLITGIVVACITLSGFNSVSWMPVSYDSWAPGLPMSLRYTEHQTKRLGSSLPCPSMPGTSKMTICPGDVIPEELALSFPPCEDAKLAADPSRSIIFPADNRTNYIQGDIIYLTIALIDGYGRKKTTGGDHLRARLVADGGKSISLGTIYDHDDGSYTAQFEALFTGAVTVNVLLVYTREIITSTYRTHTLLPATRDIEFQFINKSNKSITEATVCHPFRERLSQYSSVCNLTTTNSDMPFYCGKPQHASLSCDDWIFTRVRSPNPKLPITAAEQSLMSRDKAIPNTIKITVAATVSNPLSTRGALVPCNTYNTTELWYKREPTGFVHNGMWYLRHCRATVNQIPDIKTCLRNRKLYMFGDSTIRNWFSSMISRYRCHQTSERWTKFQWHKRSSCRNREYNFTIEMLPHSQPVSLGGVWDDANYTMFSIPRILAEEVGDDDDAIVVIHMFMHALAFNHNVYRMKMRRISQGIEKLLARNQRVKVLIKAPHTFLIEASDRLTDYYSYVYRNILFEEFAGIRDRVIYMDNKDMTNALQNGQIHPPNNIIMPMTDLVMAYIC